MFNNAARDSFSRDQIDDGVERSSHSKPLPLLNILLIDRLNTEFVNAVKAPDLRDKLVKAGADPAGTTPEQYTAFVQNEIAKFGDIWTN